MKKTKTSKAKPQNKVTIDKQNTIILGAGIIAVLLIALTFKDHSGFASLFTTLSSDSKGVILIEPSSAELKIGESVTFTSYSKSGTGQVPVPADWSIKEDSVKPLSLPDESAMWLDSYSNTIENILVIGGTGAISDEDLDKVEAAVAIEGSEESSTSITLENCKGVSSCKVFSGEEPVTATLLAKISDGREAESRLEIKAEVKPSVFKETIPAWAEKVVANLEERGIMKGYENGNFGVTDPVTRAQMLVLLNKIVHLYVSDTAYVTAGKDCNIYPDVPSTHFAYDSVCFARYAGWLKNISLNNGNFEPEKALQRREVASLIYDAAAHNLYTHEMNKFAPYTEEQTKNIADYYCKNTFSDVTETDAYKTAIGTVAIMKIISGTAPDAGKPHDRIFKPDQPINRVETAVMLWNLMETLKIYTSDESIILSDTTVEEQ